MHKYWIIYTELKRKSGNVRRASNTIEYNIFYETSLTRGRECTTWKQLLKRKELLVKSFAANHFAVFGHTETMREYSVFDHH